jgi:O-antigen/teichoic acid export membrane protein
VFRGLVLVGSVGLSIGKRTGRIALANLAGLALNVALNLILIPRMGILGAAVATFAAFLTIAMLCAVWGARASGVTLPLARALTAAGTALVLACRGFFAFGTTVSAQFAAGKLVIGAVYALCVWFLVMDAEERGIVLSMAREATTRRTKTVP